MATRPQKFVLITGCGAGGIGQALAREFKRNGFTTFATLLPHESRDHLESEDIICFSADVTDEASITQLLKDVTQRSAGYLNVLVNNAGICYTMPATDTDVVEVEKMFSVNVFGPMRMVRHFHPLLLAAKGTIVNIGSVGGIVPFIYGSSYNASKAALVHYGNTLRAELSPFGVKVVNIISGEVGTNILSRDYNRELPPNSVYAPLAADFQAHVRRTPETMHPDEYARGVVKEVMKDRPKAWYWRGAQSGFVWACDTFLWRTYWDWLFWRMFGLGRLVPDKAKMA